LDVDVRSNAIFVAGGGPLLGIPGSAYVYDAATGAELAVYDLNGAFVNDVIVTRDAAYFTDSGLPVLYKVPLGPAGELPPPSEVSVIPLGGDFHYDPTVFPNANGIEATPDGKSLIIAHTTDGDLYKVNPTNGVAVKIDLGSETLPGADGLVLAGKTLYVAQNTINQIGVVELNPSLTSGEVSNEPLVSQAFNAPTTVAKFGSTIYAVNARFDDWFPFFPDPVYAGLAYTVVGLPMK
jgi:sugar lactone lactonase YvrE